MARGQQTLTHIDFSKQLSIDFSIQAPPLPITKGRNQTFLNRRNKKIIARYYFHNAIMGKDYSATLGILEFEFDLDDRTISMIIKKEEATITEMRKKKPSVDSLKKEYFWPKW
jgi:hypothetical protein